MLLVWTGLHDRLMGDLADGVDDQVTVVVNVVACYVIQLVELFTGVNLREGQSWAAQAATGLTKLAVEQNPSGPISLSGSKSVSRNLLVGM
jgi:hypothetical protein